MPQNKHQHLDQQAALFKTLGNTRRLLILSILSKGQLSVNEIASLAGSTLQNVSQHLSILKKSGILETEREGQTIYYKIADMDQVQSILGASAEQNLKDPINYDSKEKK
jgi:DNA-binding transcriptional ArsR family regulator